MDLDFGYRVIPHYLDVSGRGCFIPGAIPPRRLRIAQHIDPRGGGKWNPNTDSRINYFYDMDDGVSEAIWVSSGRASGWNDTSQNSYHLNRYYVNSDYVKPYYYDDPGPGIFNGHPGLYFDGSGWLQACILYRKEMDVFVDWDNSGSGGNEVKGFLHMCVLNVAHADQLYGSPQACSYPELYPNFGVENNDTVQQVGYSFGSDWISHSGSPWYPPLGVSSQSMHSDLGQFVQEDETSILTLWGDMRNNPGTISMRLNGKTIGTSWRLMTSSMEPNVPGFYRDRLYYGACNRVNYIYKSDHQWYLACALLGYGDFSWQEVDYLESKWIAKYGIERAA